MSWGTYWMFYCCPSCGQRFKSDAQSLHLPSCGMCPNCGVAGVFVGESSDNPPENPNDYLETE